MNNWPLHVTLSDVFAINHSETYIEDKLRRLLINMSCVDTRATDNVTLGSTDVTLLDRNEDLVILHTNLVDLLLANGALFNTPEFIKEGFLPHCTLQKSRKLNIGDEVQINSLSLIDMFPDKNWQLRKVTCTFKLQRSLDGTYPS
jgi:hypothetical protein